MVLNQKRNHTDVLIVDASKGFTKVSKNNKLRASDIKSIVDTVIARQTNPKFSKLVSRDQICENDYNLKIPRHVDSSKPFERCDIYATMFRGIPEKMINELDAFRQAFPDLRAALFSATSSDYSALNVEDIKTAMIQHPDVKAFANRFATSFGDFDDFLKQEPLTNMKIGEYSNINQRVK
jgi:type I restriction enzyme M protein